MSERFENIGDENSNIKRCKTCSAPLEEVQATEEQKILAIPLTFYRCTQCGIIILCMGDEHGK